MSDPCDLTAVEMLALFGTGDLSPVEVICSLGERLSIAEPLLNATWAVDLEAAMLEAKISENRWRKGEVVGPLDGVPVSVKEMIATRGVPKPLGTAAGDMTSQVEDSPPAARLREAGAIIWGKTTNPDFGMLSSGLSSFHALARNPWDPALTPGGSSAGAGAAAAAGYGPLHLGTDIGGSIRLPAGWCGVFGLKPSFGRVPIDPPYIGRVAGPMTRSVDDSALLMSCLSRPDRRDYMSLPPEEVHWGELSSEVSNLRIALMLDAGCGTEPSPDILKAVEGAATLLASAGAYVEPIKPLLTSEMLNGLDRFWRTRFFEDTRHLDGDQYQKILPYIRSWVEPAAAYSGLEVYNGFNQIIKMQEAGNRQMADFDFLISPTAPEPAFPAEWASPTNDPQLPFEHIGYTVAYNMTGQPAASINCGFTENGLPIGLQIVGKRFDDLGVLRLARAFENLRAAPKPWPKPWEFANS